MAKYLYSYIVVCAHKVNVKNYRNTLLNYIKRIKHIRHLLKFLEKATFNKHKWCIHIIITI